MWLGAACTSLVKADRSKVHDDLYNPTPTGGASGGGTGGMSGGGGADGSTAGDASDAGGPAGDASDARPADASDTAAPDALGDGSLLDLRADGSDGG
jgi:hypothetical protein